ncbi:MAG TPA: M48 family metallopeptidase [Steroidobacteraceae bacterium]|jgi:STE24 endopeptidase|nr:M48 family metallopeptidase [Steroidobacteraceae bacterium]
MHWPTTLFIAAVAIATAVELWLAARQITAVAAHRDRIPEPFAGQLSPQDHRKAADYTVAKARLGMVGAVIDAGVTLALTVGGGIAAIDGLWRHSGWGEPWLGLAVIGTVAAVVGLIGLPMSLLRTFRIEAAFGFNRMTPLIFLADLCKGIALAVLIGGPLVLAVLVLMDHAGRGWWLAAFGCWLAVTLLITWAWPAFIAPLFNKFSPLEDASLKGRIEALLERCGFRSSGVFVVDGSRRSAHGNAYFTGIGRHKRIVFFDTLLKQLASPEIEAVLAHELGHFRLRHVRQRLIVSFVTMLVGFALLGWLAGKAGFYRALGVPTPSTHAALILFALAVPVALFFTTPLSSLWSRRHEFAADRFASQHANAQELASALVKLYRENASTLTPDRLYTAFYYSHPPALERIARLSAPSTAST